MLTDRQWAALEPLIEPAALMQRCPAHICVARRARSIRTARSGECLRRHSVPGGWRRKPSSEGARLGVWEKLLALCTGEGRHERAEVDRGGPRHSSVSFRQHVWDLGARLAIPPQRREALVA